MEYSSCGILLTENCNAKCKMCCDSRGHVRGKTLSIHELDLILHNIKECPSINRVGITGGEPMLYPDLVEHIINYDYGRKVAITIKTNGFWGGNKEKTRSFIKKWKNHLSNISFSYDEFHKEFIDLKYILNIVDIANEFKVHTDIVGCFLKTGMQPGDVLNELKEFAYKTEFVYQPVINTGAASLFDESELLKILNVEEHGVYCLGLAECSLLINPQLDVYPCCSQVIENTLLNFGNLKDDRLSNIIKDIYHNNVLHTVFTEGFTPFIKKLETKGIEYPKLLTSPCEMCAFFFKNDWFLKELKADNYYEIIQV